MKICKEDFQRIFSTEVFNGDIQWRLSIAMFNDFFNGGFQWRFPTEIFNGDMQWSFSVEIINCDL